jgi:hypothetical protein
LTYGRIGRIVLKHIPRILHKSGLSRIQEALTVKKTTYTLAKAIALDAERKIALDEAFWVFYNQMQKKIADKPELKDLIVPLETVKASIEILAHGFVFGIPMVTVEEPEDWKEASKPSRPRPKE